MLYHFWKICGYQNQWVCIDLSTNLGTKEMKSQIFLLFSLFIKSYRISLWMIIFLILTMADLKNQIKWDHFLFDVHHWIKEKRSGHKVCVQAYWQGRKGQVFQACCIMSLAVHTRSRAYTWHVHAWTNSSSFPLHIASYSLLISF